jgi:hypothetical protein
MEVPSPVPVKRPHQSLTSKEKHLILAKKHDGESFGAIARDLQRTSSTIKIFHAKWEKRYKFDWTMRRSRVFGKNIQGDIIEAITGNRRLSLVEESLNLQKQLYRETIRKIRQKYCYQHYDSVLMPPIDATARLCRAQFCHE